MSSRNDSFDSDLPQSHCICGRHASQAEHEEEMAARESCRLQLRLVETEHHRMHPAVTRTPFPQHAAQRDWGGNRKRTLH